jgi:hypothetical protein
MKLWKIWQTTHTGFDTFDAAIVAAETEDEARQIHPRGEDRLWNDSGTEDSYDDYEWAKPAEVTATYIGEAAEYIPPGVILASFHAG